MNRPDQPARKGVPKRPVVPAQPKLTASDKTRVRVLIGLAVGFVALIILGFVIPVGNVTLWGKVVQVITGTAPEGGGRVQMNYLQELQNTDEYISTLRNDLADYTEDVKSKDPAKLQQTRKFLQTNCDAVAGTIKTCEGMAQKIKEGKWDRPTPADCAARVKSLSELRDKFKQLLDQIPE